MKLAQVAAPLAQQPGADDLHPHRLDEREVQPRRTVGDIAGTFTNNLCFVCIRLRAIRVGTLDSESSDRGLNPRETLCAGYYVNLLATAGIKSIHFDR